MSGIIVWNWLVPWCLWKRSTWILPSPLFLAIKDGVEYPWSHVLPGPLELIKVHLWQLFPQETLDLKLRQRQARETGICQVSFLAAHLSTSLTLRISFIRCHIYYIYMACYLLSTIPFRPLLSYKSDRLEVHSCTIFLSVAWMVKYRNDPYRNSNMNNKIIELGN